MKKILLTIAVAFALVGSVFAQESETTASSDSGVEVRVGVVANAQPVIGTLADYVSLNVGGGAAVEIDLPFTFADMIRIGIPVSVTGNGGILKDDILSSMWNVQIGSGIYARFLLCGNNLVIQPELDYGVALNFPTANPAYPGNELAPMYTDQIIQFALYVRWVPQNIMNGAMELSAAPVYTFCPEKDEVIHYIGGRVGILFRVM